MREKIPMGGTGARGLLRPAEPTQSRAHLALRRPIEIEVAVVEVEAIKQRGAAAPNAKPKEKAPAIGLIGRGFPGLVWRVSWTPDQRIVAGED